MAWECILISLLWADIYFLPPIDATHRLFNLMNVLPLTPFDYLGVDGGSGAVFYDLAGIPVSIVVSYSSAALPDGVYFGYAASFLNRLDGPDLLATLGVTNLGPQDPEDVIDYPTW